MKNIQDIELEFKTSPTDELKEILKKYSHDPRAGVKKIHDKYSKKLDKYYEEITRLKELSRYENYYFDSGLKTVAGLDEVGRGPLAGPVVACCVVLKKGTLIEGVTDSKKLSEKRRNEIFWEIKKKALDIGMGVVDEKTIDKINIANAAKQAMTEAFNNLKKKPDVLLIDYVSLEDIGCVQESIVKGDEKCISIGAASIVAKVMRDEMMYNYAKEYPEYGFDKNKGYGSKEHFEAIKTHGRCPIHRRSFLKNLRG
ncbi:MAG: ribonuclease HII [Defluviitaleaceae bacterium]|nr:ribonuclease HII [Defluviitaleaceae bacterium]